MKPTAENQPTMLKIFPAHGSCERVVSSTYTKAMPIVLQKDEEKRLRKCYPDRFGDSVYQDFYERK